MRISSETFLLDGPVGIIEVIADTPGNPRGFALVTHPHPLFEGANTNKVTQTLARTLAGLGYIAWRPNFRGVGKSEGRHDDGRGETDDMLAVLDEARNRFGDGPVVLAGFSFGAYVQTRVAKRLAESGRPAKRLVLVGTAAGFVEGARTYDTDAVPANTIVIHGSADETVPLANVVKWAEALELPITLVPGADHFFHRRLHLIRRIVEQAWRSAD